MRVRFNACSASLAVALIALPPAARGQSMSAFMARTGVRTESPHEGTYRYLEFFHVPGSWILPDVGALDFFHSNYRELFAGAGRTVYSNSRFTWMQEFFVAQAVGSTADNARYLWPYTLLDLRLAPRLSSEIVYFAYVPLDRAAHFQQLLERAKLEVMPGKAWKVGAGYAAYQYSGQAWQNKPFITTTVNTGVGSFELWLQKVQGGDQVQLRYALFWH